MHALLFLTPTNPTNYNIVINTDNIVSQQVLPPGLGKDHFLCVCERKIWLITASLNTPVKLNHAKGKALILAYTLSRSFSDEAAQVLIQVICARDDVEMIEVVNSLSNVEFVWS